jgi:hypothetical protein
LGFKDKLFDSMGPFPLEDTFEIGMAIIMLEPSLRPGKNDKHIQLGTVRKFRSSFSNAYHASAEGQQATVMAKDMQKLTVTQSQSAPRMGSFSSDWFKGCTSRRVKF